MTREEALAMIEAQFLGDGLEPEARARLFDAVRADPELKAIYDRYANLELGLADGNPSAMRDRILADVAASSTAAPSADAGAPIDLARARSRRRTWMLGAVTAAAAVTLFALVGPPAPAAPMPEYAMEVSAGAQALRGDPKVTAKFRPDTMISIGLRPAAATDVAYETRAVLVGEAGVFEARGVWQASHGAYRLSGRTGVVFDAPPGRYELVGVVARFGDMPDGLREAQSSPDRQVFRAPVELVAGEAQ